MNADAAGQLMMDQSWFCRIRCVIEATAAVAVGLLFRRFDLEEIGLGDVEFLRQFGAAWLAAELFAELPPHTRQLFGAASDRSWVTLMIHHHPIACDANLVAM